MEANKILTADLLDLVFEERNKTYGAYELRRSYNKRIQLALLVTGGLILGGFAALYISQAMNAGTHTINQTDGITLSEVDMTPKEKTPEPPPPPPPPVQKSVPQVKMEIFTPPVITNDKDVKETDVPPKMDDLNDARIGTMKVDGVDDVGAAVPPVADHRSVVVAPAAKADDEETVMTKVEIEAEFPGGAAEWARFLRRNLNASVPVDNGAAEGSYTVIIQFIVDKQGAVSDIRALTNHGFGMEEEAIRVMKKATRWTPALQNGHNVNAYRKQPITFVVATE
ncbi:energy transducer TonB [Paraflavisolibacter sp. H34]|uniref:energy transducer TonB n=1 Tax=Huijunlia imazamoxiresistens TaxID=3127457 RepID=UPI00301A9733